MTKGLVYLGNVDNAGALTECGLEVAALIKQCGFKDGTVSVNRLPAAATEWQNLFHRTLKNGRCCEVSTLLGDYKSPQQGQPESEDGVEMHATEDKFIVCLRSKNCLFDIVVGYHDASQKAQAERAAVKVAYFVNYVFICGCAEQLRQRAAVSS
jgi:hypothetical protein